ncbi:amidohydrolase family protein [Frankia nepalensis]|uniref:Amidohydrolase family protein n=1 Tax=Frankia nepalensis TaxID=1836974 RepID=A0A937UWF6_9ACTN|nr:amidohydrolase family protein [Frankia nepalensis]MBL7502160.1 amidohydrolase family protein [Frankia nepalensis]MBL7510574.1 amidohydrolase family protein [Frankia nepalensis]MBL7633361.1 amidohydrolase family protein [Frankia nepalensis]
MTAEPMTPRDVASGPEVADLLVVGGDVVTMDARRRVVAGGAVAVRGRTIAMVGSAAAVRAAFPGTPELDATGCVVTPGMVDAHQHTTGDVLARSAIPDDLDSRTSTFEWAVPLHAAHTPEDDEVSALLTAVEALRAGVTTIVEPGTVAHPLTVGAALRRAGIRATLGTWGWDVPDVPYSLPTGEALARQAEVVRAFPPASAGGDGLVTGWVTLVGHDLASDELLVGAAALADELDTGLTMHLAPSVDDVHAYQRRAGRGPAEHLAALGVLGPRLLLGHAVWMSPAEIELLVDTGTAIACCPWAYLRLGQGLTRAGRHVPFLRAGGRLALGCDAHNAGDRVDVLGAARLLAGLSLDAPAEGARSLLAHEAFEVATVGGAAAIGLGGVTGALAAGQQADLVVFRADDPAWVPLGDHARQLVWNAPTHTVRDVLVAGRQVVRDGHVTTVDEAELWAWARERSAALLARAGIEIPRSWPVVTAN